MKLRDWINESLDSHYSWWDDSENAPGYMYAQYAFDVEGTVYAVRFHKVPKYPKSSDILIGRRVKKKISPKLGPIKNIKRFISTVVAILYSHGVEEGGKGTNGFRIIFDESDMNRLEKIMDFAVKTRLKSKYQGMRFDSEAGKDGKSYYYVWRKVDDLDNLFPFSEPTTPVDKPQTVQTSHVHTTQEQPPETQAELNIPMGISLWMVPGISNSFYVVSQQSPGEFYYWFIEDLGVLKGVGESDSSSFYASQSDMENLIKGFGWKRATSAEKETYWWIFKKGLKGNPVFTRQGVRKDGNADMITLKGDGSINSMSMSPDGIMTIINGDDVFLDVINTNPSIAKRKDGKVFLSMVIAYDKEAWQAAPSSEIDPDVVPHVNMLLNYKAFSLVNLEDANLIEPLVASAFDYVLPNKKSTSYKKDSDEPVASTPSVDIAFSRPAKTNDSTISRDDIFRRGGSRIEKIIDTANGKINIQFDDVPISFNSSMRTTEIIDNLEKLEEMTKNNPELASKVKAKILHEDRVTRDYFNIIRDTAWEKKPINENHQASIEAYTDNLFDTINNVLRGKTEYETPKILSHIESIDNAFQESGIYLTKDTVIFRGSTLSVGEISAISDGYEYVFPQYTSCSMSPSVATKFIKAQDKIMWLSKQAGNYSGRSKDRTAMIMSISGLDNVPVLVPGDISSFPSEQEIMIPRETVVKLAPGSRVEQVGSEMYAFHVEAAGVKNPETGMVESLKTGLSFMPSFEYFMEGQQESNERVNTMMIIGGLIDIVGVDNIVDEETQEWIQKHEV